MAGVDGKKERSTALHFFGSMYGTLRTDHEHRPDRQKTEFILDKWNKIKWDQRNENEDSQDFSVQNK